MLLMTPGPTPVPEFVRLAMAGESLHHRTPEFEAIFKRARECLSDFMQMPEVLFLASSGSGAMEASVTHFCQKRALVINAGKFGERFGKIAAAYGKDPIVLSYPWHTPASVEDVADALQKHPEIDAIFVQVCESSGGLRHPVEAIAAAAKAANPDIFVVADGITAVGVEPLKTAGIDVLITGSQKALMLPPGLAMLGLSDRAAAFLEAQGGQGFYFNLAHELKNQRQNTTAWTAATTLIIGLDAMLSHINQMGRETLFSQTLKRHGAALAAVRAIGLDIYPQTPALAMVSIYHPKAAQMRKWMKAQAGINAAGGQEALKTSLVRFNNMGLVSPADMGWSLNALELALDAAGEREYDGTASRVFSTHYYKGAQ
jgi:aspartate aminotransferase-like enzyme